MSAGLRDGLVRNQQRNAMKEKELARFRQALFGSGGGLEFEIQAQQNLREIEIGGERIGFHLGIATFYVLVLITQEAEAAGQLQTLREVHANAGTETDFEHIRFRIGAFHLAVGISYAAVYEQASYVTFEEREAGERIYREGVDLTQVVVVGAAVAQTDPDGPVVGELITDFGHDVEVRRSVSPINVHFRGREADASAHPHLSPLLGTRYGQAKQSCQTQNHFSHNRKI